VLQLDWSIFPCRIEDLRLEVPVSLMWRKGVCCWERERLMRNEYKKVMLDFFIIILTRQESCSAKPIFSRLSGIELFGSYFEFMFYVWMMLLFRIVSCSENSSNPKRSKHTRRHLLSHVPNQFWKQRKRCVAACTSDTC
jgi:hypothetical protein